MTYLDREPTILERVFGGEYSELEIAKALADFDDPDVPTCGLCGHPIDPGESYTVSCGTIRGRTLITWKHRDCAEREHTFPMVVSPIPDGAKESGVTNHRGGLVTL